MHAALAYKLPAEPDVKELDQKSPQEIEGIFIRTIDRVRRGIGRTNDRIENDELFDL